MYLQHTNIAISIKQPTTAPPVTLVFFFSDTLLVNLLVGTDIIMFSPVLQNRKTCNVFFPGIVGIFVYDSELSFSSV